MLEPVSGKIRNKASIVVRAVVAVVVRSVLLGCELVGRTRRNKMNVANASKVPDSCMA